VLLAGSDFKGYQQVCTRLLQDFGDKPDASTAKAIVYTAVLSSESGIDPQRLVPLAEGAVKSAPNSHDYLETLGAALYRAGKTKEAVQCLEKAVKLREETSTWMQLFLALAHQRLGNKAEARRWLQANDRPRWRFGILGSVGTGWQGPVQTLTPLLLPMADLPDPEDLRWQQRLIQQRLRREAEDATR
jgi:tetratricopeptide (TPR) repeat protein